MQATLHFASKNKRRGGSFSEAKIVGDTCQNFGPKGQN